MRVAPLPIWATSKNCVPCWPAGDSEAMLDFDQVLALYQQLIHAHGNGDPPPP